MNILPYEIINDEIIWSASYRFRDGSPRPKCINPGCNSPVTCSSGGESSSPSSRTLRTVCHKCHRASYGKDSLPFGVTSFKKDYCENIDGRIDGIPCTASNLSSAQLELDHIDGNHINNIPGNVQTLCKNCHSKKSVLAGDYRKSCKSHRSPLSSAESLLTWSNNFSQLFDLVDYSKTDPNEQKSNLYNSEIDQLQNLIPEDTPPTSLSGIS